jgi:hypothetical protein
MIPVNVLSQPMLVVSVGPRPANSRPANPTREYEPGSGESHDPAPVHHPHPARSPPTVVLSLSGCAGAYGAVPPASRVLRIAHATDLRPALDPGASTAPGAVTTGRPTTCPADTGAPRKREHDSLTIRGPQAPTSRSPQQTPAQKPGRPTGKTTTPDQKTVTKMSSGLDRPFHMNIQPVG